MTADASIIINSERAVLRLPRAVVQSKSDGTAAIEVWQNEQRIQRDIKVGLRGDIFITVLEGLQEGDQVVAE